MSCVSSVREEAPLQQRVVREVDAGHDVRRGGRPTCSVSAKKLSGLRFEDHAANRLERHHLLGNQLGRVEDIEGELRGGLLVERLDGELELGKDARGDGVEQVAALRVRIRAV